MDKAWEDWASAQILLEHEPPVPTTACFHCQQAAEKSLKAFLVWSDVTFEKVHSLTYLTDLCEARDAGFATIRDAADRLSPYAVELRYPGSRQVSLQEGQDALLAVEMICEFVLDRIPDELRPDISNSVHDSV